MLTSFSRVVRAFQDRLAQEIEKAIHTKFSGVSFEANVENPKKPDLHLDYVFMTPWEILWFMIPMRLFRPLVNSQFNHRIPREVHKNLSRLSSQWIDAVSISIDNMSRQAIDFINNEIATIENILAKAPDQKKEIERAISDLESMKLSI